MLTTETIMQDTLVLFIQGFIVMLILLPIIYFIGE